MVAHGSTPSYEYHEKDIKTLDFHIKLPADLCSINSNHIFHILSNCFEISIGLTFPDCQLILQTTNAYQDRYWPAACIATTLALLSNTWPVTYPPLALRLQEPCKCLVGSNETFFGSESATSTDGKARQRTAVPAHCWCFVKPKYDPQNASTSLRVGKMDLSKRWKLAMKKTCSTSHKNKVDKASVRAR